MTFEFATAGRILFGNDKIRELTGIASTFGNRALFVTGSAPERIQPLLDDARQGGIEAEAVQTRGEPTIEAVKTGVDRAKDFKADFIIGVGGGSPIDAAKAIAALATNPGAPLDYLEVIGRGQPLTARPLPCIAVPTTAGTGAEVTKNAVLASPEHKVKVSLRHPLMLPDIAIVDPELTHSMPPAVTAATGMDALTQLIEPFTCCRANPMTDGFCREGIRRVARALKTAHQDGSNAEARQDMALASLLGGLSLANAGLGAVHGFAGPIGGMFNAPHGAVCAALLPHAMSANVAALTDRATNSLELGRYREIAGILLGDPGARIEDGIAWVADLCADLAIPSLSAFDIQESDIPAIVEETVRASSMKANPIQLTTAELTDILQRAL